MSEIELEMSWDMEPCRELCDKLRLERYVRLEKPRRLMVDMSFEILRKERSMAVTRGEVEADVVFTFWHVTLLHPQGPLPESVLLLVLIQSLMFEDLKDGLDC